VVDLRSWSGLVTIVGVQITYPLVSGSTRAALVVVTVLLGWAVSVGHARRTRGWRFAAMLLLVTTGGGLAVEAVGVATGFPFGRYGYGDALGPMLYGVPVIIPLAWTWMAWPAWLAATMVARRRPVRIAVAAVALAGWDLFLDPQMVAEGYWHWVDPWPALPGVPGVPVGNYLGWLTVALAMMLLLAAGARARGTGAGPSGTLAADAPMLGLYLWTYYSSVLAHAVFLGLPGSASWGGAGMGLVAIPLTVRLLRR
jgi:putative membrane protein